MDELGVAISPSNRKYVSLVDQEPPINTDEAFPHQYLTALSDLWADPQVKECYANAYAYSLQENLN